MAYLDFATVAEPTILRADVRAAPKTFRPAPQLTPTPDEAAGLSALEWSVVALARRDSLASLRRPGRLAVALGGVFGTRHNPRLADAKLEGLRRMAVYAWHHGYAVPQSQVRAFLAAGYTLDHYETMMASISVAKMAMPARKAA